MSKKTEKDGVIILSALEEDLVTALLSEKELYGLAILGKINQARRKQQMPELSIGSLYPTLKRLSEAGLIKGEWRETVADGNSPRRKYYSLLMEGQIAIERTQNYRNLLAKQKDYIDEKERVLCFQLN
jgi:hypothetical protein